MYFFFFFKQKTAYEMRISDWSSDVCSSDLIARSHTARSHIVAWRSAAVVALGAALGLGFYLMLYGAPAAPPIALAPTAAPPSTTKPMAVATVEPAAVAEPVAPAPVAETPAAETAAAPALPEPTFGIIRIEPDGQSILAGRALP